MSNTNNLSSAILGIWVRDPEDIENIKEFGPVILYFFIDGRLTYEVPQGKIFLTWRIEGNTLITDQPSHPREDRSSVSITEEDKLKWGSESYVRAHLSAPHRFFQP